MLHFLSVVNIIKNKFNFLSKKIWIFAFSLEYGSVNFTSKNANIEKTDFKMQKKTLIVLRCSIKKRVNQFTGLGVITCTASTFFLASTHGYQFFQPEIVPIQGYDTRVFQKSNLLHEDGKMVIINLSEVNIHCYA